MTPYYSDALITLYHGDCREILPQLERFDVCLTDPPYNVANIGPNERVYNNQMMKLSDEDYLEFCRSWFTSVRAETIIFTPGIANTHLYPQPKWQLCWHKPAAVSFNRMGGFNAWEPIFVYGDTSHVRLGQDYLLFNTMNLTKGYERDHPCPKPTALWSYLLSKFGTDGVVVDPFAGSGTTLKVAALAGRRAVGIEIEESYCELIANRLSQEVFSFK